MGILKPAAAGWVIGKSAGASIRIENSGGPGVLDGEHKVLQAVLRGVIRDTKKKNRGTGPRAASKKLPRVEGKQKTAGQNGVGIFFAGQLCLFWQLFPRRKGGVHKTTVKTKTGANRLIGYGALLIVGGGGMMAPRGAEKLSKNRAGRCLTPRLNKTSTEKNTPQGTRTFILGSKKLANRIAG